jgi:hypothetical protein
MANPFKRAVEWGGNFTTAWGLLPAAWQTAATTALSGVTMYFGYYEVGLAPGDLWEGIRQPSKAAHVHAHGGVAVLSVGRADMFPIR